MVPRTTKENKVPADNDAPDLEKSLLYGIMRLNEEQQIELWKELIEHGIIKL